MATIQERNARLDELASATKKYAAAQRAELNRRVDVSKRILQGRTGSERLAQSSVQQSTTLVVGQINDFLTG
jgi:3'-phosphoadenosine 5'-phosphosulfate sulfotransferase